MVKANPAEAARRNNKGENMPAPAKFKRKRFATEQERRDYYREAFSDRWLKKTGLWG